MEKEELISLINDDLKDRLSFLNESYGYDIRDYLVPPVLETYKHIDDPQRTFSFWTVWDTEEANDFVVFFDENEQMFGYGIRQQENPIYMCHVGTLAETLEWL